MQVRQYYEQTRFDYRLMWNLRGGRALHFGFYDHTAKNHHAALDNLNRVMADLAGVRAGEHVLDAGCGLGSACFWLAEHAGAEVTGINIVGSQILDCQKTATRKKISRITFLEADYLRMPFPDASFEVVWACESVCHTVQKADFYREAFRVLKPGGRLVMAEYIRAKRPLPPQGESVLKAWLHPWAISDLDTADEHGRHAQHAGFEDFSWQDVTQNVRVSLRNLHEISQRWLPLGAMLHRFGWIGKVRLENARASIYQWQALQEHCWMYGLVLARKA